MFDWADSAGATSYDVKVDGTLVGTVTASKWVPNRTFTVNVKHSWQVIARNAKGTTAGPSWTFGVYTQAPAVPKYLTPANGATLSARPTLLDWSDTVAANSYDVYVDGNVQANVTSSQYSLPTTLVKGTHTWRIVAKNPKGVTTGPTWSFKF